MMKHDYNDKNEVILSLHFTSDKKQCEKRQNISQTNNVENVKIFLLTFHRRPDLDCSCESASCASQNSNGPASDRVGRKDQPDCLNHMLSGSCTFST